MKITTKSVVLAGLIAATAQSTHAANGIYLGAAVGGNALTGKSSLFINRFLPAAGANLSQTFNSNISDKNVAADIFLGFGKKLNCAWLGAELLASWTSLNSKDALDISSSGSQQPLNFKTTFGWGAAANIGYYVNPNTKLYLKLGVEFRRFTTTFAGAGNTFDPNIVNINKKRNSTAFVPGFGMETDINARFSVRGEYRIALHQNKTSTASTTTPNTTSIKVRPTIHYFNLGLTYRF
jgi:opacity protein-like surface antigen